MKKIKTIIEIIILAVILVIMLWLGAFLLRDKSELFCKMSFGEYKMDLIHTSTVVSGDGVKVHYACMGSPVFKLFDSSSKYPKHKTEESEVPVELPNRKDYQKREVTPRGKELGWTLGEVLIEFEDTEINLASNEGAKKALELVARASDELAPKVVKEMMDAGTLPSDYELKEDLITFGRTLGPNGAILSIAIDEAEDIISEELKKYNGVEDASPNYIGSFF